MFCACYCLYIYIYIFFQDFRRIYIIIWWTRLLTLAAFSLHRSVWLCIICLDLPPLKERFTTFHVDVQSLLMLNVVDWSNKLLIVCSIYQKRPPCRAVLALNTSYCSLVSEEKQILQQENLFSQCRTHWGFYCLNICVCVRVRVCNVIIVPVLFAIFIWSLGEKWIRILIGWWLSQRSLSVGM